MGVVFMGIAKLFGLAAKAIWLVIKIVGKILLWTFFGAFLLWRNHKRKKETEKLEAEVAALKAAQNPTPTPAAATTPATPAAATTAPAPPAAATTAPAPPATPAAEPPAAS